uniref:Uncharacterized protein n=1 Tax=Oryzias melastigma TaxID=30732 RepID=A0A3B3CF16_ORYME
ARPFALSIQEKRKKYIYIKRKKEKRTRRRDPSEPRRLHAERAPLGSHALGCSFTQRSVRAENWEITSLYGCASSAKTISRPGLSGAVPESARRSLSILAFVRLEALRTQKFYTSHSGRGQAALPEEPLRGCTLSGCACAWSHTPPSHNKHRRA